MHFSEAGGRTVATDLATFFGSIDAAILDAARLTSSVMETHQTATGVTPGQTQRVVDSLAEGLNMVVAGRRKLVATQRSLIALKGASNLDVVDYGCLTVEEASLASKPADARSVS
jgi:hypothetical protein